MLPLILGSVHTSCLVLFECYSWQCVLILILLSCVRSCHSQFETRAPVWLATKSEYIDFSCKTSSCSATFPFPLPF